MYTLCGAHLGQVGLVWVEYGQAHIAPIWVAHVGYVWPHLAHLGPMCFLHRTPRLGPIWARVSHGVNMGRPTSYPCKPYGAHLGYIWAHISPTWPIWDPYVHPMWGPFGPSGFSLGCIWAGPHCSHMGLCGIYMGPYRPHLAHLGPIFTPYVGTIWAKWVLSGFNMGRPTLLPCIITIIGIVWDIT